MTHVVVNLTNLKDNHWVISAEADYFVYFTREYIPVIRYFQIVIFLRIVSLRLGYSNTTPTNNVNY